MLAVRRMAMAWLLMLVPALAAAQASAPAADPLDPMNPGAPVPALPDIAPLAGYIPYQAPKVAPWRQSNADVAPARQGRTADAHAGHRMAPAGMSSPASESGPAEPAAGTAAHEHHAH